MARLLVSESNFENVSLSFLIYELVILRVGRVFLYFITRTNSAQSTLKRVKNELTNKIIQKQVSLALFSLCRLSSFSPQAKRSLFSVFGCRVIGNLVMVKGYTQRINTRQNTRFLRNTSAASSNRAAYISIIISPVPKNRTFKKIYLNKE